MVSNLYSNKSSFVIHFYYRTYLKGAITHSISIWFYLNFTSTLLITCLTSFIIWYIMIYFHISIYHWNKMFWLITLQSHIDLKRGNNSLNFHLIWLKFHNNIVDNKSYIFCYMVYFNLFPNLGILLKIECFS